MENLDSTKLKIVQNYRKKSDPACAGSLIFILKACILLSGLIFFLGFFSLRLCRSFAGASGLGAGSGFLPAATRTACLLAGSFLGFTFTFAVYLVKVNQLDQGRLGIVTDAGS